MARRPLLSSHLVDQRWARAHRKADRAINQALGAFHRASVSWRESNWRAREKQTALERARRDAPPLTGTHVVNTHCPGSVAFAVLYGGRHERR